MTYGVCPFQGDVCQDGVQSVVTQSTGLRPRDYGVNLDNRVLIDHQVTCAPLKTEPFLLPTKRQDAGASNETVIWFGRKFHDPTFSGGNGTIY
jgi:hypothetical protein